MSYAVSSLASSPLSSSTCRESLISGSSSSNTSITGGVICWKNIPAGLLTGFICPQVVLGSVTDYERGWMSAILYKGNPEYLPSKSKVAHIGSQVYEAGISPFAGLFPGKRVKYIYTTTILDIIEKISPLGGIILTPERSHRKAYFTFEPELRVLADNYQSLFYRSGSIKYLGAEFPKYSLEQFSPKIEQVLDGDFLMFWYITDTVLGVYWVTSDVTIVGQPFIPIQTSDGLSLTKTGKLTRGGAILGDPVYLTRGDSSTYTFGPNHGFSIDRSGSVFTEFISLQ